MTFPYTPSIPNAPNDPADDQALMQQNYASIQDLIGVNHVLFNTATGGQHTFLTFNTLNPPSTAPLLTTTLEFTDTGEVSSDPQLYFQNLNNTFLLNCVKAFGVFNTIPTAGPVTFLNSYNCASVTAALSIAPVYTVTLTVNCTTGNNVIVLIQPKYGFSFTGTSLASPYSYSFTGGVLQIKLQGTTSLVSQVSFLVLQA